MDLRGVLKLLLFIFLIGCAFYVGILILTGINNSLREIPWWMIVIMVAGGVYFYDTSKKGE